MGSATSLLPDIAAPAAAVKKTMTAADDLPVPETRVLAIASHVVSGNVGNKIAVFTMQSLGCEVAALNTVQFSNHTGYNQWKGSRVTAEEITELWEGLKQSYLDDFDMMLSGYIPGAAAVEAVGRIGRELRAKKAAEGAVAGSFFWVLDPVMGDNGNLYVAKEVVPAYKALLPHADLILPNQFEAELLSGIKIEDMASMETAVQTMHVRYGVPHIVITSVALTHPDHPVSSLSVVGSTMTSDGRARPFKIVFPFIDGYFSGTGDMFAALMVVRMREAVSGVPGLAERRAWLSNDDVEPLELPLAKAAEKVLASMNSVLLRTNTRMRDEMRRVEEAEAEAEKKHDGPNGEAKEEGAEETEAQAEAEAARAKKMHLLTMRAAELRLVRNLDVLRHPQVEYTARKM